MGDDKITNYLDWEKTFCIKGYLALLVLISHLYQFSGILSGTNVGYVINMCGHYGVVGFMFLSGYGLCTSYRNKGDEYMRHFPLKRLLPFFITYLLAILIYSLFAICRGNQVTFADIFASITFGNTVVGFGWYLQMTLWLYVAFFVVYSIPIKDSLKFVLMGIMGASYIVYGFVSAGVLLRYIAVFPFLLGFAWSNFYEFLSRIIERTFILCILLGLGLMAVYMKADYMGSSESIMLVACIFQDIGIVLIILGFLYISARFCNTLAVNPLSRFCGKYSLEIYIIQALTLQLLANCVNNRWIFVATAITTIVAFAMLIHNLIKCIMKALRLR